MTPTLAATLNGALATTLVLFGLICAVWIAVDAWRNHRYDRRMRRGFRAARRYGLINNGDER